MIAKKNRLTSKDISYILRKGKKIHTGWFTIFVIPQYTNLLYHQVSPQISTKIHKRSTVRNPIRRAIIDVFYHTITSTHIPLGKILIMPNKQSEEKRIAALRDISKEHVYALITKRIQQDFYTFASLRGNPSPRTSLPSKTFLLK